MADARTLLVLLAAASIPPALPTPSDSARIVVETAERLDAPFPARLRRSLDAADDSQAIWQAVARSTLIEVEINPEMRVKVAAGKADAALVTGRPRAFFVRIDNRCGTTARLAVTATDLASPDAGPPDWLDIEIADVSGHPDRLSGAPVEYKLLICRAEGPGRREARLGLDAGQGTQDLGFRGVVDVLFHVRPNDAGAALEP